MSRRKPTTDPLHGKYVPVRLLWADACSKHGWQDPEKTDFTPIIMCSVGWLVHQAKHVLSIAQSIGENGELGDILTVPMNWVVKVKHLR